MSPRKKGATTRNSDSQRNVDNSAKTLLANIRFMRVDDPVRTVVITSAIPNEGKTFVAANLARAMATSGIRTLLVETDMRRRSMAHVLHTHAQHGLYAVMAGEVSLDDAVVSTSTPRLDFLDSEPHIPNPSDLLDSRRFVALIEQAKQEYGYIVFDTPPISTFVDAVVLGSKADALFLVVREQFTRKDEVARSVEQLRTANVELSGIIMNYCSRDSSDYYYYDYYYREQSPRGWGARRENKEKQTFSFNANRADMAPSLESRGSGAHAAPSHAAPSHAASSVSKPKNWNNAPDLDDDGVLMTPTMTQSEQPSASKSTAAEEKQKRDQANPYM